MISRDDLPETPDWHIVAADRACEALIAIGERAAQRRLAVRDTLAELPERFELGEN